MAQMYIPVERSIPGPWFITKESLEELHPIIVFVNEKLIESATKRIKEKSVDETELKEVVNRLREGRSGPKAVLYFSGGSNISDDSLEELLKDQKLLHIKPKRLKLSVDYGFQDEFNLTMNTYGGGVDLSVKAYDIKIRDDITYRLDSWLDKYRPNKMTQIWSKYTFIFAFIIFVALMYTYSIRSKTTVLTVRDSTTTKEIKQILEKGVTSENQAKAIELLIKYTTNYNTVTTRHQKPFSRTDLNIGIALFFLFGIFLFSPKTIIGIGENRNKVANVKTYVTIVLFVIPSGFFWILLDHFLFN